MCTTRLDTKSAYLSFHQTALHRKPDSGGCGFFGRKSFQAREGTNQQQTPRSRSRLPSSPSNGPQQHTKIGLRVPSLATGRFRERTSERTIMRSSSRVVALLLTAAVSSSRQGGGPRFIMAQQEDEEQSSSSSSSFNASSSATATASSSSPLSYQSCVASWVGADISQDGFLSRAEYINWIRTANPYPNCPNISSINAFLSDLPFATTFTNLACLCIDYSNNQTCCHIPRIALPATYPTTNKYNTTYSIEVCQIVRNVLASECTTTPATTDGSSPTAAPTGTIEITYPPPFNVSSSGHRPTPSPVSASTPADGNPVEWPNEDPNPSSSSSAGSNQILQVALPLLLVALAALLLGLTVILYQKRRHRLLLIPDDTPNKQLPNASTGGISHSEGSTESDDEHAVIIDPELEHNLDTPDPTAVSGGSDSSSSGRVVVTPRGGCRNNRRAAASKASPRMTTTTTTTTVRLTSLLNSIGLEPLREETCSEDEDGATTHQSVAAVEEEDWSLSLPPLNNGRHSPTTTTHDRDDAGDEGGDDDGEPDEEWGLDDSAGGATTTTTTATAALDVPNRPSAVALSSSSEPTKFPQCDTVEIVVRGNGCCCETISDVGILGEDGDDDDDDGATNRTGSDGAAGGGPLSSKRDESFEEGSV